jgi:hypothetical protein
MKIEDLMRRVDGYELEGFENFNRSKVAGPVAAFVINMVMWTVAIGVVSSLAVAKSAGYAIP